MRRLGTSGTSLADVRRMISPLRADSSSSCRGSGICRLASTFHRSCSTAGVDPPIRNPLPAYFIRGGTSKGIFLDQKHLPTDRSKWKDIFRGIMGSPDPHGRQLNGMGGGLSSLSKIVVVGPSDQPDVDVEYTFVQVGIKDDSIDMAGNCGNLSSAVGPYAIESGILEQRGGLRGGGGTPSDVRSSTITVSLFNTNTKKRINTTFPRRLNDPNLISMFSLDGVSGTAAKITMDYVEPGGARTGKLLPTGNLTDTIAHPSSFVSSASSSSNVLPITVLDCTNPTVYVRFSDLGLTPSASPDALDSDTLAILESIRQEGARLMGLDPGAQSQPKIALVGPPLDYKLLSGEQQEEGQMDLFVRALSMGQPHKAIPMTVAMATAVAARLVGTVVSQVTRKAAGEDVRIGHPSGTVVVGADITADGHVKAAKVFRTARFLMRGEVYW